MTLERHRSRLIPNVDFSQDGRLFVTDSDGIKDVSDVSARPATLSSMPIKDINGNQAFQSLGHSKDPKRRKFKPKQSRFEQEVRDASIGTWTSKGSHSLQRKMRKLHQNKSNKEIDNEWMAGQDMNHLSNQFGNIHSNAFYSVGKSKKKKAEPTPRMDYPGSLNRQKGTKAMDMAAIKEYKERIAQHTLKNGTASPLMRGIRVPKVKHVSEEKLTGVFFLICGIILIIIGVLHILTSWWHQYYCIIWTGVLIAFLGMSGIIHQEDYLTKWKNMLYIVLGMFVTGSVLATISILLQVIIPVLTYISFNMKSSDILTNVSYTNMEKSLAIKTDAEITTYLTLVLDLGAIVICLVNFYALSATLVALVNHWDAVYTATGECNHRGSPRFFNPIEQITMAHVTCLIGIITCVLWRTTAVDHFWSLAWAPILVFIAGIFSFCYAKRPDIRWLGILAMVIEVISLAVLTYTAVYAMLAILDDVNDMSELSGATKTRVLAAVVFEAFYIFIVFVNIIFIIGLLYKLTQKAVCKSCFEDIGG